MLKKFPRAGKSNTLDFGIRAFYTGSRLYGSGLDFAEFRGDYICLLAIVVMLILATLAMSSEELQSNSSIV